VVLDVLHHHLELRGPFLGVEGCLLDLRLDHVDEVVLLVRFGDELLELLRGGPLLHLGVEDLLFDLLVDRELLDELGEELFARLDAALGRLLDFAHELLDLLMVLLKQFQCVHSRLPNWCLAACRAKRLPVTYGETGSGSLALYRTRSR
jgi:hypothetical protein